MEANACERMSDEDLLRSLKTLVADERRQSTAVLRHLAEVEARKLYEGESYGSMFIYCVRELKYSECEAYRRIHAARAAREFPRIYGMLDAGELTLSAVSQLAPHLRRESYSELLDRAAGKTTRGVEALVATLSPAREPLERIRHLGIAPSAACVTRAAGSGPESQGVVTELPLAADDSLSGAPQRNSVEPAVAIGSVSGAPSSGAAALARQESVPVAVRVHFSFTGDEELLRDIERARELLRNKHPRGKLEEVIKEALKSLLDKVDPLRRRRRGRRRPVRSGVWTRRAARTETASERRREIPRRVKYSVWERDGGRCMFRASDGRRCEERGGLEYDHVVPWAKGGSSNDAGNIRLMCRAHNQHQARRSFGASAVAEAIRRRRRACRRE